jgi:hypothetical protein
LLCRALRSRATGSWVGLGACTAGGVAPLRLVSGFTAGTAVAGLRANAGSWPSASSCEGIRDAPVAGAEVTGGAGVVESPGVGTAVAGAGGWTGAGIGGEVLDASVLRTRALVTSPVEVTFVGSGCCSAAAGLRSGVRVAPSGVSVGA